MMLPAASRTSPRRAFTLLELIIVVVVLGVLAAIAVPTFAAVKDRSAASAAETTLVSVVRDAQALIAFDDGTTWSDALSEVVTTDLAFAPGVSAASTWTLLAEDAPAQTKGDIAWSSDGTAVAVATVVSSDVAAYAFAATPQATVRSWSSKISGSPDPAAALEAGGPAESDATPPEEPTTTVAPIAYTTTPTFVAQNQYGNSEDNPTLSVPAGSQPGDLLIAVLGGDDGAGSVSGTGWTYHGQQRGSASVQVWSRFLTGAETSYKFTNGGVIGSALLVTYRGVTSIDDRVMTAATSRIGTVPGAWSDVGYGSLAFLAQGHTIPGDYPTAAAIVGWRRDSNARRWHHGAAAYSTPYASVWANPSKSPQPNGSHSYLGLMLHGSTDEAELVLPERTTTPSIVSTVVNAWTAGSWTVPPTAEPGDMILAATFSIGSLMPVGTSEPGWWGLGYNGGAFLSGYVVQPGDPGVRTQRIGAGSDQSHLVLLVRGVDPNWPLVRILAESTAPGVVSHPELTLAAHSALFESIGANISHAAPNATTTGPWTSVIEHNRWNPWGALLFAVPDDDATLSGLTWDARGTVAAYGVAVELRGAAG